MLSQTPQQQALFPDLPRNEPVVNPDGTMNDNWKLWFDSLVYALQQNLKPEGFVIPQKEQSDVDQLDDEKALSNILYNSTINQFIGNILNPDVTDVDHPDGTQFWYSFAMITDFAGNPNGNVSGFVNLLCLDTITPKLYICTTAGDAATAVWTAT